jgi:hypothetical protein
MYTAPYIMLLMPANPLRGQVGGGWALEIETFWALSRECLWDPKKSRFPGTNPLPLAQVMDLPASKNYVQGCINQRTIGSFMHWRRILCTLHLSLDFNSFVMGGSGLSRSNNFRYAPAPPPLSVWAKKPAS